MGTSKFIVGLLEVQVAWEPPILWLPSEMRAVLQGEIPWVVANWSEVWVTRGPSNLQLTTKVRAVILETMTLNQWWNLMPVLGGQHQNWILVYCYIQDKISLFEETDKGLSAGPLKTKANPARTRSGVFILIYCASSKYHYLYLFFWNFLGDKQN